MTDKAFDPDQDASFFTLEGVPSLGTFSNTFNGAPPSQAEALANLERAVERIRSLKGKPISFYAEEYRCEVLGPFPPPLPEPKTFEWTPGIGEYIGEMVRSLPMPMMILLPPKERRLSQCPCLTSLSDAVGLPKCWRDAGIRRCRFCRSELPETLGLRAKWCSKRCRQAAWYVRQIAVLEGLGDAPKRLAIADPPYPGLSAKYYRDEPTYAGEVDHRRLLEQLSTQYDGFALCTSQEALPDVLSLVPRALHVEVCPWVKPIHRAKGRGILNVCEFVLVVPARRRFPGVPDSLVCGVARGGPSKLIGRKPLEFVLWVFQLLGALPVDSLDDLFPGTGIFGHCWGEFCRTAPSATARAAAAPSPMERPDSGGLVVMASTPGAGDVRR